MHFRSLRTNKEFQECKCRKAMNFIRSPENANIESIGPNRLHVTRESRQCQQTKIQIQFGETIVSVHLRSDDSKTTSHILHIFGTPLLVTASGNTPYQFFNHTFKGAPNLPCLKLSRLSMPPVLVPLDVKDSAQRFAIL